MQEAYIIRLQGKNSNRFLQDHHAEVQFSLIKRSHLCANMPYRVYQMHRYC